MSRQDDLAQMARDVRDNLGNCTISIGLLARGAYNGSTGVRGGTTTTIDMVTAVEDDTIITGEGGIPVAAKSFTVCAEDVSDRPQAGDTVTKGSGQPRTILRVGVEAGSTLYRLICGDGAGR